MARTRRLLVGLLTVWLVVVVYVALQLDAPALPEEPEAVRDPALAARGEPPATVSAVPPTVANTSVTAEDGAPSDSASNASTSGASGASIVSAARSRVAEEAARRPEDEELDVAHTTLQGAAVELLTAQSECVIQTFTNRLTARASSIFDAGADGRHGAALAFDADSATSFHSSCGLPNAPWWITYAFDAPTTVSTLRLTADAPADYPKRWELQACSTRRTRRHKMTPPLAPHDTAHAHTATHRHTPPHTATHRHTYTHTHSHTYTYTYT
jgi:hypothetical protein